MPRDSRGSAGHIPQPFPRNENAKEGSVNPPIQPEFNNLLHQAAPGTLQHQTKGAAATLCPCAPSPHTAGKNRQRNPQARKEKQEQEGGKGCSEGLHGLGRTDSPSLLCFSRLGEGPKVPKASHRSHPMAAAQLNGPNLHFWDVPVSAFHKRT